MAALTLLACLENAAAANLVIAVRAHDGMPLSGVIVMAHSLDGSSRPVPPVRTVVDQVDLAFTPDLTVIPVGSMIDFPNSDTVSHQIYSFSPAKRFQLPLYRGTPYPPVRFDRPGLVTLGCNIHDGMLAYIVVTDAAHYGRTDASGTWNGTDVPQGKYRVSIWHPRLRDAPSAIERELTVAGERAELEIRLTKPLKPSPVQGRPRSWDAY